MARRLTLVAGGGDLVPHLAAAMQRHGEPLQVLDLVGRQAISGVETTPARLSDAAALIAAVRRFRTTHLVLAGAVHISDAERRDLADALGMAGKFARSLGDIGLAGMILLQARLSGIRLVGAHQVLPELVAPAGHIAGPFLRGDVDKAAALRVARTVGSIDLGQAVVLSGTRPVAAEDAGGTDALLSRVRELRDAGLVGGAGHPLLLAKARKPRQPRFVDLPSIGPQTVTGAAAAGICAIVLEAGATLLLDRPGIEQAAAQLGVTVVGSRG